MACWREGSLGRSLRRPALGELILRRGGVSTGVLGGVPLWDLEGVVTRAEGVETRAGGVGDLEEEAILFGLERAREGLRERWERLAL